MKRIKIAIATAMLAVCAVFGVLAIDHPEDNTWSGINWFQGVMEILGTWKIDGVEVTATAAQLNQVAGANSGITSLTGATVVSNANLKVYGSNLIVKAGGTVSLPVNSIHGDAILTNSIKSSRLSLSMVPKGSVALLFTNAPINTRPDAATYLQVYDDNNNLFLIPAFSE